MCVCMCVYVCACVSLHVSTPIVAMLNTFDSSHVHPNPPWTCEEFSNVNCPQISECEDGCVGVSYQHIFSSHLAQ